MAVSHRFLFCIVMTSRRALAPVAKKRSKDAARDDTGFRMIYLIYYAIKLSQ